MFNLRKAFSISLLLSWLAIFASHAQEAVFHSESHLVNMSFAVHGADGKTVPNLKADDFEIREDGVPQKIFFFAHENELPLSLGLIVDVSDSQGKFLKRHRDDIETFLRETLRPSDEAFAVCFGNHLRLVSNATSSPSQIMEGLDRFDKGERNFPELGPQEERELGTALYDAIYFSTEEKLDAADGNRRRALILFTDGEENSSEHDLLDAIAAAQNADVLIFAVRYTQAEHGKPTARNKYGVRVLGHLASQTGGSDFDGLHTNLREAFRQISDELRSLYSVAYQSTNKSHDGTFRKIVIESKREGFTVRAKAGYYAR